jgi:hypothetical protein
MRALVPLLAVSLLVGCGSSEHARPSIDVAELVPPDAVALISFDTDLNSARWQRVTGVVGPVYLGIGKLDFERDVRPAVGDQAHLAVFGPEDGLADSTLWFMRPKDESKLPALVDALGPGYELQRIGAWAAISDSAEALARVRQAESGRSLAEVDWFRDATTELSGDFVATSYAKNSAGFVSLPDELRLVERALGSPRWLASGIGVQDDAVLVQVSAAAAVAVYRPRLLREAPAGALLAVSFKNGQELLTAIAVEQSLREYRMLLTELAPALRGEGVFYVSPGLLLPTLTLEIESPNPARAAQALRDFATRLRGRTRNLLALRVITRDERVVLTNATGPEPGARSLVDDQTFKDALAAADAPEEVSWLAYADIHRLAPIVEGLSQLLSGRSLGEEQKARLDRLGTLVAFGARSGATTQLVARITIR